MGRARQSGAVNRLVILLAAVAVLDVVSKFLAHHFLPLMNDQALWYPYGGIGIFRGILGIEFSISHTTNTGAAWGAFADSQHLLLGVRILLITALVTYIGWFNKHAAHTTPLALVATGAICNVVDFFFYGHVVDMLHFVLWGYDYPVFNVADVSIFCGITWILVHSVFFDDTAKPKAPKSKARKRKAQ